MSQLTYVLCVLKRTFFRLDGSFGHPINPSLVLVQPRKTRPYITERLLMGRK